MSQNNDSKQWRPSPLSDIACGKWSGVHEPEDFIFRDTWNFTNPSVGEWSSPFSETAPIARNGKDLETKHESIAGKRSREYPDLGNWEHFLREDRERGPIWKPSETQSSTGSLNETLRMIFSDTGSDTESLSQDSANYSYLSDVGSPKYTFTMDDLEQENRELRELTERSLTSHDLTEDSSGLTDTEDKKEWSSTTFTDGYPSTSCSN